jgi:hypothetical protein
MQLLAGKKGPPRRGSFHPQARQYFAFLERRRIRAFGVFGADIACARTNDCDTRARYFRSSAASTGGREKRNGRC